MCTSADGAGGLPRQDAHGAPAVTVRPFEPRDADRASAVLDAAFESFLHEKRSRVSSHFRPDMLVANADVNDEFMASRIFVAEENGQVVGVVKVTARTHGLGALDYIGVNPAAHGRGIGSLLMARSEAFWSEHRQRKIDTCVSAHNKRAIQYYLKHDFIPEGYRRDHFIVGVDEIILGRFLRSSSGMVPPCQVT